MHDLPTLIGSIEHQGYPSFSLHAILILYKGVIVVESGYTYLIKDINLKVLNFQIGFLYGREMGCL